MNGKEKGLITNIMDQLKKDIIDNLTNSNFYDALKNIKKLESDQTQIDTVLYFYYFLYDFMEWLSEHKKDNNIVEIRQQKEKYFNQINVSNNCDKSNTYTQLYVFMEQNFTRFTLGMKFTDNNILKPILKEIESKQNRLIKIYKGKAEDQKLILEETDL